MMSASDVVVVAAADRTLEGADTYKDYSDNQHHFDTQEDSDTLNLSDTQGCFDRSCGKSYGRDLVGKEGTGIDAEVAGVVGVVEEVGIGIEEVALVVVLNQLPQLHY